MTVRRLEEEMDAAELMEWVAYYQTKDDKLKDKLLEKIADEASLEEKAKQLRAFLSCMGHKK